ncbi:MAG: glutamate--cysteine ligase [Bacteriovoracales bacterium]|nr:glutamate--cysteine ligase [Bacteriovoracales bacterium]
MASSIRRGLERECLRVTPKGDIADTLHSKAIGSALTHPYITTDYSEALLEFITPTLQDPQELLDFLQELHLFTLKNIGDEILWNNSMPCLLRKDSEIPIAYYGTSNIGKMKTIYRKGLFHRYGSSMQTISGVHFNFSLSDECFEKLRQKDSFQGGFQDYKSKKYMTAIRNIHKYSWLIPYMMGSSPSICRSFLHKTSKKYNLIKFDERGTLSYQGATSLRLSHLGYTNAEQFHINISYNSLESYIRDLRQIIHSKSKDWEKIGIIENNEYKQLNDNILQLENEYYSGVRPKRKTLSGESPTNALAERGVEYIEIRSLDVNPFSLIGINLDQILFLDVFLLFCLLSDAEKFDLEATNEYRKNQELVARHGRTPDIVLFRSGEKVALLDWGKELFQDLFKIAHALDGTYDYSKAISTFEKGLTDPNLLYSAKLECDMQDNNETFFQHTLRRSAEISDLLRSKPLPTEKDAHLAQVTRQSLKRQEEIEKSDDLEFKDFLAHYFQQNI